MVPEREAELALRVRALPEPGLALRAQRPELRPEPVPERNSDCTLPAVWPSRARQECLVTSFW